MSTQAQVFGFGNVARLSGVHPRTLDDWAHTGFLAPSVGKASGRGTKRAYSARDVVAAAIANRLRQSGVALEGLRGVVAYIQRTRALDKSRAGARLVVMGKTFRLARGEEELVEALRQKGSRDALVIDIGRTADEIRRGLEEAA